MNIKASINLGHELNFDFINTVQRLMIKTINIP